MIPIKGLFNFGILPKLNDPYYRSITIWHIQFMELMCEARHVFCDIAHLFPEICPAYAFKLLKN